MLSVRIRTAVLTFFALLMILIFAVLMLYSSRTQRYAVQQKGEAVTRMHAQVIQTRLQQFFLEPVLLHRIFTRQLAPLLRESGDFTEPSRQTYEYLRFIRQELPHVQVMAYGNTRGHTYGIRTNPDLSYSLIIQDDSTDGQLFIYDGPDTSGAIIATVEDFDPRTRPWYLPVQENPVSQWSPVYVNADEFEKSTISYLNPVFSGNEAQYFHGVMVMDITLGEISTFLKGLVEEGRGRLVILDETNQLVAHSENDVSPEVFALFTEQVAYLAANNTRFPPPRDIRVSGNDYFLYGVPVDPVIGLDWTIHILLPVTEIVGDLQTYLRTSLLALGVIIGLFMAAGFGGILFIIRPFQVGAELALQLSGDGKAPIHEVFQKEDQKINLGSATLKESQDLTRALRSIGRRLRQTAQEARISEDKYRYLVENSLEMFFTLTPDGRVETVNKGVEILSGRSRTELHGLPVVSLAPEPAKPILEQALQDVLSEKTKIQFQSRFISSQGNDKTFNTSLMPILNDQDEVSLIVGTSFDISDLILAQEAVARLTAEENDRLQILVKEKTEELRHTMQELFNREKMASLGEMVAGFSHEINSPLGVAQTAASYLKESVEDFGTMVQQGTLTKSEFEQRTLAILETTGMIQKNLNRAGELITSFKALSVDQTRDEAFLFDLNSAVQSVLVSLGHEIRRARVRVDFDCPQPFMVQGQPGHYSQLFTNFIMNSLIHGFGSHGPEKSEYPEKSERREIQEGQERIITITI